MTIAQIVYDNELHFGYSHDEIHQKVLFHIANKFLLLIILFSKIANAYMDSHGRLHPNGSLVIRGEASRSLRAQA
jgi:hypothetical protein